MEINVGEFVRTKFGIAKYLGLGRNVLKENTHYNTYHHYENQYIFDENIFDVNHDYGNTLTNEEFINIDKHYNHSKDIIDLIQVGDYVNGYYIENIRSQYDTGKEIIILEPATGSNYFQKEIYEDEIKSIVTHEQFEAMEYKVGNNNE